MLTLTVVLAGQSCPVQVPEAALREARDFFAGLDRDMDRGWQMSRQWVDAPDPLQRCQIVADRLYTAIEHDNRELAGLLAAYLLERLPGVCRVLVDVDGNMQDTAFEYG